MGKYNRRRRGQRGKRMCGEREGKGGGVRQGDQISGKGIKKIRKGEE